MATLLPLVVPKNRTVTLGDTKFSRERLSEEIEAQSRADVEAIIRDITTRETANQIRLGNPPSVIEIDNSTTKRLAEVQKKSVVIYGTLLAGAAMRMAETELRAAILKTTNVNSGRLSSLSNWEWRFVPKNGAARVIKSAGQLPSFGSGDKLVLVPVGIPYATMANRNVARSGQIKTRATKKKAAANMGFLGATARKLRTRTEFRQFAVIAEFTKAHQVPGELMTRTQGTGVITIRPRFRRARG